jgi:hypothetical protein
MPVMTPRATAMSYTERAMGPPVSNESASGMIPSRLTNPCVGFRPAMPLAVDDRAEPGVVGRNARETQLGQLLGGERAGGEGAVDVGDRRGFEDERLGRQDGTGDDDEPDEEQRGASHVRPPATTPCSRSGPPSAGL